MGSPLDPATNLFAVAADTAVMNTARELAFATLLPSGKELIAGGVGTSGYLEFVGNFHLETRFKLAPELATGPMRILPQDGFIGRLPPVTLATVYLT